MPRKSLPIDIKTGLTEPVGETLEATVLDEGALATALNCHFTRHGVLRLWRPALELASDTTFDTAVLDAIYIPEWDKVAILSTTAVKIYDSDFTSLEKTVSVSFTDGMMAIMGSKLLVASTNKVLRSIEYDGVSTYTVYLVGSLGSWDVPVADDYDSVSLNTGSTSSALQTLTMAYSADHHYHISYVRVRLARKTDSVGKVYCTCQENIDAGGWTEVAVSDNHVYVAALAYGDTEDDLTAHEFTECIFTFTGANTSTATTSHQIRFTLTYVNGDVGNQIFILDKGAAQASAERMYTSASGDSYIQVNGSVLPKPGSIAVHKARLFTGDDAVDGNRVCVSDINDPNDFDRTLHGTYFYTDYDVSVVWAKDDSLLVSGSKAGAPVTVSYTGRWPEGGFPAYEYDVGPASNREITSFNRMLVTVSNGSVAFGQPTTYAGLFDWQFLHGPEREMASNTYKIIYDRSNNLVLFCALGAQDVYCLQLTKGLWTAWELTELAGDVKAILYVGSSLYILDDTGKIYIMDKVPESDHSYQVEVGMMFTGTPQMLLNLFAVTALPALPEAAEITLTGWNETNDIVSTPTQYWQDTFVVRDDALLKGFYQIPLPSENPYPRMFNHLFYKIVLDTSVEKTESLALRTLGLYVDLDNESAQYGVDEEASP